MELTTERSVGSVVFLEIADKSICSGLVPFTALTALNRTARPAALGRPAATDWCDFASSR